MLEADVHAFRSQMRMLHRRLRYEVEPTHGVTRSAFQVLGEVARQPGVTPREISDRLAMTSSNVAAALRELKEAALVTREQDRHDRRKVLIRVTAEGEQVVETLGSERDSWLARAIEAVLTNEEQDELVRAGELMGRIAEFETTRSRRGQLIVS